MLVDHHGDPIAAAEALGSMDVAGNTGLRQQGGYIYEEPLVRLQGEEGIKVFTEMSNSSTIGAVRYLFRALVRQINWRVEPADESPAAKEEAENVEGAFGDMEHTLDSMVGAALSCLDYGWAYFDITYKLRKGATGDPTTNSDYNDGKWGWRKVEIRSQESWERWVFDDETDEFLGMWQWNTYTGKRAFIPISKALHFVTEDTRGNPEGRSLWRNAVTDYHNLKRTTQIELVGIERDMTGLLTMEVPLEVLQATTGPLVALRNEFAKMLSSLKRDEREFAMVPAELDREGKPTGFVLKLLTTGGRRQIDISATKRFSKIAILQTVLAQFLELGMERVGALSVASSFTSTFGIALGAILNDVIAGPINEVLISRLMKLNKVPVDLHPTLVPEDIEKPSLDIIGKYLTALFGAGFDLTGAALQRKVFEIGGFPIPDDDEPTREAPTEQEPEPETEPAEPPPGHD